METYFTDEVYQKFETMYEGDKARDASAKVRGFLFQDLIAIEFLLENQVQHVFLEFLEDIDVAYEDGRFEVIQVKYYPKKNPDMKEIITDLYYQYLLFDLLNGDRVEVVKIKPHLVIHSDKVVNKPDLTKMRGYIGEVLANRPDSLKDVEVQLRTIIPKMKKDEQRQKVFSSWAYEKSLSDFLDDFEIIPKDNIRQLQDTIEIKLEKCFSICDVADGMQENRRKILMGLAVIFIQERYKTGEEGVQNIRVSKADFVDYIQNQMKMYSDKSIIAYIIAVVTEEYEAIITENDDLSEEQRISLNAIYKNTVEWIGEECSKIDGQFRIVNTLCTDTYEQILEFGNKDAAERLLVIAGCKENIKIFLRYLWKVIFDIYSGGGVSHEAENGELLKPQNYIDKSKLNYICIHFPQDCVETSVILPPAYGVFKSRKNNHRLRLMKEKPRKWFMKCDSKLAGKHEYDYSTAEIVEKDSVTNLNKDNFIIECMQCVKIDEHEWTKIDDCKNCIFAETCIKGE